MHVAADQRCLSFDVPFVGRPSYWPVLRARYPASAVSGFRGGSAASLDIELIALRVGHHDPATRRDITAVIDDSRAEGHNPVDFLILRHTVWNEVKMNPVLHGLLFRYLDEHKPHSTFRGRANHQ
jgi:hypothetical protein